MSQPHPPYGRQPYQPHQRVAPPPAIPPYSSGGPSYGPDYGPARYPQTYGPPAHPEAGSDYQAVEFDHPPAPILRRAGARLIDGGLLGIFGFAVVLPIMIGVLGVEEPAADVRQTGGGWSPSTAFAWFLVVAGLPFAYEAVQLALWGRTFGKRVLGLRVVAVDPPGEDLSVGKAVVRAAINNVGYLFGCGVGTLMAYLWAIWDAPLHQAVHDRLAGTVVIDDRVEYED
jgi:uncharacterized RDD family membrane protein YckC